MHFCAPATTSCVRLVLWYLHVHLAYTSSIEGTILKCVSGLQLTPASNGGCCVNHNLSVEPSLAPPAFLDGYTEKIFLAQIEGLLADLRQELDRIRTSVS